MISKNETSISGSNRLAFQCLALCKVSVVALGEEARLVASDNALKETGGNLGDKLSGKDYRRTPGLLTLKKRASIVAPDCVLPADFPTIAPPSPSADSIFRGTMNLETIELAIEKATGYIEAHSLPTDVASVPLNYKFVAERIDHTLLKQDATPAQITLLCEEAKKYHFKVKRLYILPSQVLMHYVFQELLCEFVSHSSRYFPPVWVLLNSVCRGGLPTRRMYLFHQNI